MVQTAAHLADHVFPRLPVRQWVLSVPKRLSYFLQTDTALQGAVLRIFLRALNDACSNTAAVAVHQPALVRWPSSTASAHP